jgi:hypothetical protein
LTSSLLRFDLGQRLLEFRFPFDDAPDLDHGLGEFARLAVEARDGRDEGVSRWKGRDSLFVRPSEVDVEEIDLPARLDDRLGSVPGAVAVARRRVERHRDDDEARLVERRGQSVDAGAGRRGGVGIKRHEGEG